MSNEQIAAVFSEWKRQWDEEPEKFATDAEHKAGAPDEYGARAAKQFLRLAEELAA